MKVIKYLLFFFTIFLMSFSPYESNHNIDNEPFEYRGKYVWNFKILFTKQTSIHTFFEDRIEYEMKGKIYSTAYTMKKISYDKKSNKWIGKDEKENVYVLFFKDKTPNSVTIYKHKCKDGGLQEAKEFQKPASDTKEDHGWNVYHLKK